MQQNLYTTTTTTINRVLHQLEQTTNMSEFKKEFKVPIGGRVL